MWDGDGRVTGEHHFVVDEYHFIISSIKHIIKLWRVFAAGLVIE